MFSKNNPMVILRGSESVKEEMLSVGIDIGTSTTQLVFSKITIENLASSFAVPMIKIVGKEILFRSEIYFTPLLSQTEIDGEKVREIVENEYRHANICPKDVKTGAVIITGETARKTNANQVLQNLSGLAGDFVVATAGPDLESIISAKGAGANVLSEERRAVVANLDIGGGTTNIAVFKNGKLIGTTCLDIGGRLIKIDNSTGKITYIYSKIKELAKINNILINEGDIVDIAKLEEITRLMANMLEQSVNMTEKNNFYNSIFTNNGKGLDEEIKIDYFTFSGGVADHIYNDDEVDRMKYGDVGVILGRAIRNSQLFKSGRVETAIETIRATVVGAGTHTTEISGSTITYTEDKFPIKNLPILKVDKEDELCYKNMTKNIIDKLQWFQLEDNFQNVAIAIEGKKKISFKEIQELAHGLIEGLDKLIKAGFPLIILVENDIAKILGQTIYNKLSHQVEVICIDSIKVDNGDYIDIGCPVAEGKVVPVIIKTLVFNS